MHHSWVWKFGIAWQDAENSTGPEDESTCFAPVNTRQDRMTCDPGTECRPGAKLAEGLTVKNQDSGMSHTRYVSVSALADKLGKDLPTISKWLLRHDINLRRRAATGEETKRSVVVLTQSEATQARYLHRHGVLFQEASR